MPMSPEKIIIRGARQHNLRGIDLEIPRHRLVVITGLSGSGKSSLAFDTLYAEGQRRYVESLSVYARQFLEKMEKPDVDLIEGLSPAIAIEQKTAAHNPRSTVGTVTEIYDFLRLLFARTGAYYCHRCKQPISSMGVDQMISQIITAQHHGARIIILAPLAANPESKTGGIFKRLRRQGFARVRVDGKILELETIAAEKVGIKNTLEVVIDRLVIKPGIRNRLADSLELALALAGGVVTVEFVDRKMNCLESLRFSEKAVCLQCGIEQPELTPASFSFNSPHGACPACDGLGTAQVFDPGLIVPNPGLSLRQGAIAPWNKRQSVAFAEFIDALTSHYKVDIYTPYSDLPEEFKQVLLYGSGKQVIRFYRDQDGKRIFSPHPFEGIIPNLQRRYRETDSAQVREEIGRFMRSLPCPECKGSRLRIESRSVRINGLSIDQIASMNIEQAVSLFSDFQLEGARGQIAAKIISEIKSRLDFLMDVGLAYLTLDRAAHTLSGGESQRIRLATQIGSKLTGVLYVLDEPSIGLHPRDTRRLLSTLTRMRDMGNTVLVVEHDRETIEASDYVIDMGPGAGAKGGQVVFAGPPDEIPDCEQSLTGQYLAGRQKIEIPAHRRSPRQWLGIQGASLNNLKTPEVRIPLGCLVCVTGVSGSGKSSLVLETLYPALLQHLNRSVRRAGPYKRIYGLKHLDKAINIDQSPIGKTPRSNPGTYTGVFNFIRELFSKTQEARARGYRPGRFSFNVKGGRCEACKGDGIIKIEMHFLPDIYITCDVCKGLRYNRETLEVRYKGRNIAEVLDMTVNQAMDFFSPIKVIRQKLETLIMVGLGYIRLGQPANTLSGGEAQRVKLARELSKQSTGRTIYLLDEPTTGLHMEDIKQLLFVLNRLVDAGNTVVIIEHNLDVIKTADYLIDLGPEGGDDGGRLVACGTPEEVALVPESHTGRFLASILHA